MTQQSSNTIKIDKFILENVQCALENLSQYIQLCSTHVRLEPHVMPAPLEEWKRRHALEKVCQRK